MSREHFLSEKRIGLDFIRPGRPVENCYIESFNGRLRDECLNMHWFQDLDDARRVLEDWRQDYNEARPHSSLSDNVPAGYVQELLGLGPRVPDLKTERI
jgi:putative transposase